MEDLAIVLLLVAIFFILACALPFFIPPRSSEDVISAEGDETSVLQEAVKEAGKRENQGFDENEKEVHTVEDTMLMTELANLKPDQQFQKGATQEGSIFHIKEEAAHQVFVETDCLDLILSRADIGELCPFVAESRNFKIQPYCRLTENQKQEILSSLQIEWGAEELARDKVESRWQEKAGNVLFVLTMKSSDEVLGCVAVDTVNFYPFISNLLVQKERRNTGLGACLLNHAEKFAKRYKFGIVKLWCKPDLKSYYLKKNYFEEAHLENGVFVMTKYL